MGIRAEPINSLRDAMIGRRIRNTYCEYMTGDPSHITVLHQVRWYYGVYCIARIKEQKFAWLFYEGGRPVGYGGISLEQGRWWLTAGLVPEARGRGLGTQIFSFLTYIALGFRSEAWLKVYSVNEAARRLYRKLGFEYVGEVTDFGVLTMKIGYDNPRRSREGRVP